MAPSPVLDYIVVHADVSHGLHESFERVLESLKEFFPDYEQRKEWLKNNGIKYDL